MTQDQIINCRFFHLNSSCEIRPNNRQYCVRRTGKTKLWKRSPKRFKIPVKFGLYQSGYIDETNVQAWHASEDCPLLSDEKREEWTDRSLMEAILESLESKRESKISLTEGE